MIATLSDVRDTHNRGDIVRCVDACLACVETITLNAFMTQGKTSRPTEQQCADLGCAFLCAATARLLTSLDGASGEQMCELLESCREVCSVFAEECEQFVDEHCTVCARVCRDCEQACAAVLESVA